MKSFFNKDKHKTFRPKKKHTTEKRETLHKYAKATLGSGNMSSAVALPKGEDIDEWLAVNTVDFFNEISLLYGTVTDFCTAAECPCMSAGPKYEYLWADGTTIKTPIKVPAPEYIDYLMLWVEGIVNNEAIFPVSTDTPFPRDFQKHVKTIFKRLFRVYAHIYHSHFRYVVALGAEAHLNTCFKHFIFFILQFDLVEKKELAPLNDLIAELTSPTRGK